MTQIPFKLTAGALNHDGTLSSFAEYIKLTGNDPKHSININYTLSRLPSDSEALDREKITINYETGEIFTHPRTQKDNNKSGDISSNDTVSQTDGTAAQLGEDEEDNPITIERINLRTFFEEFSKCFSKG